MPTGAKRGTIEAMALEITWLGRTCFRLKGREGVIVTDPCAPESGYRLSKVAADVVTLSNRGEAQYSCVDAVSGYKRIFEAPGEYEVGGILVTGIATKRADGRRNIAYIYELDGIRVAHLGLPAPGPVPDELKGVDVLLFPAGGGNSLGGAAASDVMTSVDAHIAIPMNFATEADSGSGLDHVEKFLKESGAKPEPQPRLSVNRSQLPAELTVVLLEPRG